MIYAIGDIHGQKSRLEDALALIEADGGAGAPVVFLGDYADRGPDVRGVIQTLIDGIAAGRNWTALKGNHDRMFLRFLREAEPHDRRIASGKGWLHPALGGQWTLASYDPDPEGPLQGLLTFAGDIADRRRATGIAEAAREVVPEAHLDFLAARPLWHEVAGLRFVHAGIRPGVAMADQDEDDLLWIREPFLSDTRDHGALVVHGHTALEAPEAYPNRVNLDGGAGYGRPLLPAVFEGRDCWLLTPRGRVPLLPA